MSILVITLNISDAFPKRAPSEGLAVEVFGGAPFSGLVWVILIVTLMHIVLTKSRWGVYTIAIGGNQLGAEEAGVPATNIKMRNFVVLSSVLWCWQVSPESSKGSGSARLIRSGSIRE